MTIGNTASGFSCVSNSSLNSDDFYEKPPYLNKRKIIGNTGDTTNAIENISTIADRAEQIYSPKGFSPLLKLLGQERKFHLLQIWEGIVEKVTEEEFIASLQDKTNPSNPEEGVEISLGEVSDEDLNLVRPGAVFYWSIGYEDSIGFPRQRVSRIRFRRLSGWTPQEIMMSEEKAKEFARLFE